jgi:EXLDI family protein
MMPNKTIYVADADLPIFERAQELAGENLSATIAAALRRFVSIEEARASGFGEIVVKVGENGLFAQKQFTGRELAKQRLTDRESSHSISLTVYETAKGRLALYTRVGRDWSNWTRKWTEKHRKSGAQGDTWDWDWKWDMDWSSWPDAVSCRLDVYENAEQLREHVSPELHAAVVRALSGNDIEILDI